MILYIRGFPATDLVKYDGSLDDGYLEIILIQLQKSRINTMFPISPLHNVVKLQNSRKK